MQLVLFLCIVIAILSTASSQPSDNGTQIAVAMPQTRSTTGTTPSSIPSDIKRRLTCSVVNKTCMDLGPVYEDEFEYLDVCYPVYDDDGRVEGIYAACIDLCRDYFKDGVGKVYKDACVFECSTFPDLCLLNETETTATTPEQTVKPRSDPYSVEECCNATDYICQGDPVLIQNCGAMCYPKHVSPGKSQSASCKPACTSDDHIQLVKCDEYCPHYNDTCRIYNIVTVLHSTSTKTATTTTTEAPTTKLPVGSAIGIAVAVVILLVAIGGIAFYFYRRKRAQQRQRRHNSQGQGAATPENVEEGPPDRVHEREGLMRRQSTETSSPPGSSNSPGSSRTDEVELDSLESTKS